MELELPDFLIKDLKEQYGDEITQKIVQGYRAKRKATLRVNTIKATGEKVRSELQKNNINLQR